MFGEAHNLTEDHLTRKHRRRRIQSRLGEALEALVARRHAVDRRGPDAAEL